MNCSFEIITLMCCQTQRVFSTISSARTQTRFPDISACRAKERNASNVRSANRRFPPTVSARVPSERYICVTHRPTLVLRGIEDDLNRAIDLEIGRARTPMSMPRRRCPCPGAARSASEPAHGRAARPRFHSISQPLRSDFIMPSRPVVKSREPPFAQVSAPERSAPRPGGPQGFPGPSENWASPYACEYMLS
jgi:hypothetical protein